MSAKTRSAEVVLLPREPIAGARVARVASFSGGELRVRCDRGGGAVVARVSAALDDASLAAAARDGEEALVLFEEGDPARPVVIALLRSRSPVLDALVPAPSPVPEREARVDGRRIVVEGSEEVVLRCGEASLTLRRDGTVVLRGVNVVSQARQVHKIRGGKVQIN